MQKLLFVVVAVATILACNPPASTPASAGKDPGAQVGQSTGPDGADLLRTLQGRWQSEQDPTYVLEVVDSRMRHIHNGQTSAETMVVVDGQCQHLACKTDTSDLSDGWCFLEKSLQSEQCNLVLMCDKNSLKYAAIGATGGLLVFRKIE